MSGERLLADGLLGPLNVSLSLDDLLTRRMVLVNALPSLMIAAVVAQMAIAYYFNSQQLSYFYPKESGAPEFWERVARAAQVGQLGYPVATASLFLAGMRRWTEAQGSWMLAFGAALAGASLTLVAVTTVITGLTEDTDFLLDLKVFEWTTIAPRLGFLSIGYFFVAYRGLSAAAPSMKNEGE